MQGTGAMSVRLRLKELAEARDLNISQLQRQSGLDMGMVRRYWYNQGRNGQPLTEVNLTALGILARVLDVQPGDLLEQAPDRDDQ
jgi:DNA-binding Xre family transcriptional regulator